MLVPRATSHVYCNCPWKFVNPEVLSLSCPCLSRSYLERLLYEWCRAYSESLNHGIMLVTPVRIWQCRDAHFTDEKTHTKLRYMLDEISSTLIWHFHSPLVGLSPYKQIGAANIAVNNVANNAPATANCHFSCGKGSQLRQFSWAWFLDWAL